MNADPAPLIPSLRIRGFRAFQALDVPSLGQVTLVTGDNHTGKTSLLEAIEILGHGRSAAMAARAVLARRGEFVPSQSEDPMEVGRIPVDPWTLDLERLHHTGEDGRRAELVEIGRSESDPERVALRAVWASLARGRLAALPEQGATLDGLQVLALEHTLGNEAPGLTAASDGVSLGKRPGRRGVAFVGLNGVGRDAYELWDQVALTAQEEWVVDALRKIDPGIQRVTTVEVRRRRSFNVRVDNAVRPLSSLGDGVGRVLHAALAVATSSIALLDEVDAGVHYSRQTDLWRVLFDMAQRGGGQVVATTHSLDNVRAFAKVAAESPLDGKLVHLQQVGGRTRAVVLDETEVGVAAEQGVEVR
jgi:hypothetical protein